MLILQIWKFKYSTWENIKFCTQSTEIHNWYNRVYSHIFVFFPKNICHSICCLFFFKPDQAIQESCNRCDNVSKSYSQHEYTVSTKKKIPYICNCCCFPNMSSRDFDFLQVTSSAGLLYFFEGWVPKVKLLSLLRYPDATPEDLQASDNVCIICREEMVTGAKKLPCNHIFHSRWVGL